MTKAIKSAIVSVALIAGTMLLPVTAASAAPVAETSTVQQVTFAKKLPVVCFGGGTWYYDSVRNSFRIYVHRLFYGYYSCLNTPAR